MLVVLPKNGVLPSIEKTFSLADLQKWKQALKYQKVDVYIPKFKFEAKYAMSNDLKAMGMPTAFTNNADFSGMTGKKDLFISDVIHQAFVEVDEKGTEAAAATAVVMKNTAVREESEPISFIADHPFIFLIKDNTTGNILFMGRVTDPTR